MEICLEERFQREKAPSILDIKNKIRLGHDECCNCYCCKVPQFPAYKYVQPGIPKSFRPIRCYDKSNVPLDDNTTYRLSYWPETAPKRKPILPTANLKTCEGEFEDITTHKMSYLGNWRVKPMKPILPCSRQLLGRGPMQGATTQKCDFKWKYGAKQQPIKYRGNLCLPRGHVEDNTTYKLSYYDSHCLAPVKSFRPLRRYQRSDEPIDACTTYRLSFFGNQPAEKEVPEWMRKPAYQQPTTPLDGHTTYKLSFWPQCAEPVKPFRPESAGHLFTRDCCFDDNTIYKQSYFGCGGGDADRPGPILPKSNKLFADDAVCHDTVNKMSYPGNWCVEPAKPILPCSRQLLGRGPIQDVTTQKCDFTWKYDTPPTEIRPQTNLEFSQAPLEACTTNKLSYMSNCLECITPTKSFAPIRRYQPADVPMDLNTTNQCSYMPVCAEKIEKPWAKPHAYHKPTTHIDDNTTYALSFMAPGTLVPCYPECPCVQPNTPCSTSIAQQRMSKTNLRHCISC